MDAEAVWQSAICALQENNNSAIGAGGNLLEPKQYLMTVSLVIVIFWLFSG